MLHTKGNSRVFGMRCSMHEALKLQRRFQSLSSKVSSPCRLARSFASLPPRVSKSLRGSAPEPLRPSPCRPPRQSASKAHVLPPKHVEHEATKLYGMLLPLRTMSSELSAPTTRLLTVVLEQVGPTRCGAGCGANPLSLACSAERQHVTSLRACPVNISQVLS